MTQNLLSEDGIDWKAVALELADHLLHYEPQGALQAAIRLHSDPRDHSGRCVRPGATSMDMDGMDPLPGGHCP